MLNPIKHAIYLIKTYFATSETLINDLSHFNSGSFIARYLRCSIACREIFCRNTSGITHPSVLLLLRSKWQTKWVEIWRFSTLCSTEKSDWMTWIIIVLSHYCRPSQKYLKNWFSNKCSSIFLKKYFVPQVATWVSRWFFVWIRFTWAHFLI